MLASSLVNKAAVFIQVVILSDIVRAQLTPSELNKYGVPPSGFHSFKPYTNETIDEILTRNLGGIGAAVQKMLAPNGKVLAELDMLLLPDQFLSLYSPKNYRQKRKAIRQKDLRWTNALLPYEFIKGDFTSREIYFMKLAMTEWEKYSCVRFRPSKTMDRNVVRIKNGNGCSSQLGMVGGVQELNLEPPGCRFKGLYLHELAHAIGLVHEHQLPTRDAFIDILWYNVDEQMRIWFEKYNEREVNQYKVPYDLTSVMHYGISAFSKDGSSQTIKAKNPALESTIGRVYSKELAFSDVKTVNLMYQCSAHCSSKKACHDDGFLDQNCNCICPDGSNDCEVGKVTRYKEGCKNEHDSWQCHVWANQGECQRNPKFMMKACEKACGVCDLAKTDSKEKDGISPQENISSPGRGNGWGCSPICFQKTGR